MNGFVIAKISVLVGVVVMAVTFWVYEPAVPSRQQGWLNNQEKRLAAAADAVLANGAIPAGWWRAAQTIRGWRDEEARDHAVERWIGSLPDAVREKYCAEGLLRARMAMQAQQNRGRGLRLSDGSGVSDEAAAEFDRAIGLLEAWRAERPETVDLFHVYTLGYCYNTSGRIDEAGGVLDAWREKLDEVQEGLTVQWRVHYMSHLGDAFENAGRREDAAGVYRGIGRLVVETRYAGNGRRGGIVDRPAEVVERLLMVGDVVGAEEIAGLGRGASGLRQGIWAWRDAAWALDDGGQPELARALRENVLVRYLGTGAGERDRAWWYAVAQLRSMVGQTDAAVGALGRALELAAEEDVAGWMIATEDRELEGIQGHPGYAALEARYGGEEKASGTRR